MLQTRFVFPGFDLLTCAAAISLVHIPHTGISPKPLTRTPWPCNWSRRRLLVPANVSNCTSCDSVFLALKASSTSGAPAKFVRTVFTHVVALTRCLALQLCVQSGLIIERFSGTHACSASSAQPRGSEGKANSATVILHMGTGCSTRGHVAVRYSISIAPLSRDRGGSLLLLRIHMRYLEMLHCPTTKVALWIRLAKVEIHRRQSREYTPGRCRPGRTTTIV